MITPAIDPTVFVRLMALPPELRRDLLELLGAAPLSPDRIRDLVERAAGEFFAAADPRAPARH